MLQNFPIYIGKTCVNARPGKELAHPGQDKKVDNDNEKRIDDEE
jgi:hypothetical protein